MTDKGTPELPLEADDEADEAVKARTFGYAIVTASKAD